MGPLRPSSWSGAELGIAPVPCGLFPPDSFWTIDSTSPAFFDFSTGGPCLMVPVPPVVDPAPAGCYLNHQPSPACFWAVMRTDILLFFFIGLRISYSSKTNTVHRLMITWLDRPFPPLVLQTSCFLPGPSWWILPPTSSRLLSPFRHLRDCLQTPRVLVEEPGTHGLSKLDCNLLTLGSKRAVTNYTVEDRELGHLDTTVRGMFHLISAMLSESEGISVGMSTCVF